MGLYGNLTQNYCMRESFHSKVVRLQTGSKFLFRVFTFRKYERRLFGSKTKDRRNNTQTTTQ